MIVNVHVVIRKVNIIVVQNNSGANDLLRVATQRIARVSVDPATLWLRGNNLIIILVLHSPSK